MISNKQARRIIKMSQDPNNTISKIALKADVDIKTAKKYSKSKQLPDDLKKDHNWSTRKNPFESDWIEIKSLLEVNSGLEAKTIFDYLNLMYNNKYCEGKLRTLQRKVKVWRAIEGPEKEVMFPQVHIPGDLCESDFTHMNKLNITINGQPFDHLVYHFVLTYSNWETGEVCYSECFESLSEGLQNALWQIGGVPVKHRTDRLTTAVNNIGKDKGQFQVRYSNLLDHYGITGEKTQANSPNENGDVEQRHYRFKKAVDQALMLRGNRDFESKDEYKLFLNNIFKQLNGCRDKKFQEELKKLSPLPQSKRESCKEIQFRVSRASTVNVLHNTYSVHSRLIGEQVKIKAFMDHLEVWYAQKCLEKIPRVKGEGKHKINYRHIIDWLIRKPGAFENYKYKKDMFPTTNFRIAYDSLKKTHPETGHKKYLKILHLAAQEGEELVNNTLLSVIESESDFIIDQIQETVLKKSDSYDKQDVIVDQININLYDDLLEMKEEVYYA